MSALPALPQIPESARQEFIDGRVQDATRAVEQILADLEDGKLSQDDAASALEIVVVGAIQGTAILADYLVVLPEPVEGLSDSVITAAANALTEQARELTRDAIEFLDDLIGYNPRRAAARLFRLLERDAEDGEIGDDYVGRVYRTARLISRRNPDILAAAEVVFIVRDDGRPQLVVEGVPWGTAPRGFKL